MSFCAEHLSSCERLRLKRANKKTPADAGVFFVGWEVNRDGVVL